MVVFPPHLSSVSALPRKTVKHKIADFHSVSYDYGRSVENKRSWAFLFR